MRGAERFDGDYVEALLVATVDAALMMQNVAVAAESQGLGICYIGAIRNRPGEVAKLLGLPPFVFAVAGMCLGYPAEDPQLKPRLPVEAVLHRERYPEDAAHRAWLERYDRAMTDFYSAQGMHADDPRWTQVAAGRVGRFHDRAELDRFLRAQGFDLRPDRPS
jgi:nitroreductase